MYIECQRICAFFKFTFITNFTKGDNSYPTVASFYSNCYILLHAFCAIAISLISSTQGFTPLDPTLGLYTSQNPSFLAAAAVVGPIATAGKEVPTLSAQLCTADGLAKVTISISLASFVLSGVHSVGFVVYVLSLVTCYSYNECSEV